MNETAFELTGNIVDIVSGKIFPGKVTVSGGRISHIKRMDEPVSGYVLPGFIDAHVHIESSMLVPSEFARLASVHGTVATVSDPHEIANVMGIAGVHYMINNSKNSPMKFYFGAPSCVPATTFETAGGKLDVADIESLLAQDEILYLSEMMNVPGVLYHDTDVHAKLDIAKKMNKPVDGHAPGLRGDSLKVYAEAGISTDHECFTLEEARDKILLGMNILIREGSAARNFDVLSPLIDSHPDNCMLCSDDKHPDDLQRGHINQLVQRAVAQGIDVIKVLRCATLNPIRHYGLDVGLLQTGDAADFIVVDNLEQFNVQATYIDGVQVADQGKNLIEGCTTDVINSFHALPKTLADFRVTPDSDQLKVIDVHDGQLTTRASMHTALVEKNNIISDVNADVLKIVVINRYQDCKPAIAFVRNFGLKEGAIASSVAHDSHNIIAVGVNDEAIMRAVNLLIAHQGGVCAVSDSDESVLPLPVAGIMSADDAYRVSEQYAAIDRIAHEKLGSNLRAPFMTLSFMALLVIPELKLSDKGLFDGNKFQFTELFAG